ncbi:MAG: DUF1464 family protein [Candidatus Celaenobacter polaris]|nr:DUF1464 family protein [Candidatus Celaenobacter polaris]
MRVVGIDPGTYSFNLFGMENDKKIIVDKSIKSEDIFRNPHLLIDELELLMPLDMIVGPSGYGIPTKSIKDMTEDDIGRMIPLNTKVAVNEGIKNILVEMKQRKMPVYFTPGVIHLTTVLSYRKWNKFDMGTADKVCCVALGIKDQSERLNIPFNKTSFIYAEIGYGFTVVIAVENGRIIDGIGGTNGSLGFLGGGGMDVEIAIRLKPPLTQEIVFQGGIKDFVGIDIEPKDLINFKEATLLLGESVEKDVASILVSMHNTKEMILSGRLTAHDFIKAELTRRLNKYAPVVKVNKLSEIAKEAACGAYIIGEGMLGGKYHRIVENMGILNGVHIN